MILIGRKHWLLALIRWRDWGISKSPVYFWICLYLALAHDLFDLDFLISFFSFFVFLHLYGIYGLMINDYSDREWDRQSGKTNIIGEMSKHKSLGLIALILVAGVVSSFVFFQSPFFMVICVLSYTIATFYSLPPVRFKERGPLGLLVPAIAQQTLPVLLIFSAFNHLSDFGVLIFSFYVTFIGFRKIAEHIIMDQVSDLESGLKTYGMTHGIDKVKRFFRLSCLGEIFFLFFSLIWISIKVFYGFFLLLIFFTLSLCLYRRVSGKTFGDFVHEFCPVLLIPIFISTLLFIQYFTYIVIFLFIAAWQHRMIWNYTIRIYKNVGGNRNGKVRRL